MLAKTCPFCGETDFDLIGLKIHFMRGWCDVWNVTPDTHVVAAQETFACLGGCGASVPSKDAYCSCCFLRERGAQKETPAAPTWRCTICSLLNPDDATHCRQCEYSRMVLRDGKQVPRDRQR
jgi:hypothetical protein